MKFISTSSEPVSLDELQYRIATLFGILTLVSIVFFGVSDYILGLNPFIGKVRVLYGLLFLGCFCLMVQRIHFELAINLMVGLILTFSILNFFYNDGYLGPTIYNLLVYVVAVAIFFKKAQSIFWYAAAIGSYLLVFYLTISGLFPVVSNYGSEIDLFWDNALTIVGSSLFIFIGVTLLIVSYQKQHHAMLSLKQQNEQHLVELTALNEKKNRLIALLTHDLRNPIATLTTSLELAEQDILERDDWVQIFSGLKTQSIHLNHVLDNTLEWVSAEMDDRPAEQVLVRLSSFNEEIRKIMQIQAARKRQHVVVKMNGEDAELNLEVHEIQIILKNLLENAIKFSPVGAKIELSLHVNEQGLCWEVSNEGLPISEQVERGLFDFKAKASYGTDQEKGSGLGLSLCKKIAEKLQMDLGYQLVDGKNVFYLKRNWK
jgi:two-component system sensor histidine kinase/response regulator